MKKLLLLLLCVPLFGLGQKVSTKDLKLYKGICYLESTMVPFTGVSVSKANYPYDYLCEVSYRNGKMNGVSRCWKDNVIDDYEMYLDGVKIEEKIYENGSVKEHIFYDKQGNKEESISYYENGNERINYWKGGRNVRWILLDENGKEIDSKIIQERSVIIYLFDNYKYLILGLTIFILLIIYLIRKNSVNENKTNINQYKESKKTSKLNKEITYNNLEDIERQYNTYIRRFRRRIYTKKMFSNKIDILNKEIEKLKRLNKIPKDYPLFEVK